MRTPSNPPPTVEISADELNGRVLALCEQRNAAMNECALLRGQIARLEALLRAAQVNDGRHAAPA